MKKIVLAAIVAALIPLAAAGAENQKQPATPAGQSGSFDMLDSNKAGYLTTTEAEDKLGTGDNYGEADRNSDGRLDRAEFSAWEMSTPSDSSTGSSPTTTMPESSASSKM